MMPTYARFTSGQKPFLLSATHKENVPPINADERGLFSMLGRVLDGIERDVRLQGNRELSVCLVPKNNQPRKPATGIIAAIQNAME